MATTPQTYNGALLTAKAPNLPIAPVEYTQQYMDQVLNALRLYFNQIDNFNQGINTPNSGPTSNRPVDSVQAPIPVGQPYYDTTIATLLIWNGTAWVSAIPSSASPVTSFSAGTTGFTPSSATTGAVTLAGTLNVANGGTGNSTNTAASVANSLTIGTGLSGTSYNGSAAVTIANTGVTSAIAGTGISVSSATGAVTIGNTGVTSINGSTGAVSYSNSKTTNGYTYLPGGTILQWGTCSSPGTDSTVSVTFPITFPNALLNLSTTHILDNSSGNTTSACCIQTAGRSTSGFTIIQDTYGAYASGEYWSAIGY